MEEARLAERSLLVLALVEIVAQEIALPVDSVAEIGVEAARIGNLESLVRIAADQRDAVIVVDDVIDIAEGGALVGLVVERRRGAVDAFDAKLVAAIVAAEEVIGRSGRSAILDRRLDRAVAAAVDRDLTAIFEAGLGGDVDDAGGAETILGGQRAG